MSINLCMTELERLLILTNDKRVSILPFTVLEPAYAQSALFLFQDTCFVWAVVVTGSINKGMVTGLTKEKEDVNC